MQIKRLQIHNQNTEELQRLIDAGWRQWSPPFMGQFGECVYLCKEDDAETVPETMEPTPRRRAPRGAPMTEIK